MENKSKKIEMKETNITADLSSVDIDPTSILREKSRQTRAEKRQKKREAAKAHKAKAIGDRALIYKKANGASTVKKLPKHFHVLLQETKKFAFRQFTYIDKNNVSRTISKRGRRKLHEILTVLVTTCDLKSGKIGVAKKEHMDTTSHDMFMLKHAERFGYAISSSTWYRYIDILKALNVFSGTSIKIFDDETKSVRSEASYKYLSNKFLVTIGVLRDGIRQSIDFVYNKAIEKGFRYVWRTINEVIVASDRLTTETNFELFNGHEFNGQESPDLPLESYFL